MAREYDSGENGAERQRNRQPVTISRKSRQKIPAGCLYLRAKRWWWKVRLPGQAGKKSYALRPDGQRFATKDRDVAIAIAWRMWEGAEVGLAGGELRPSPSVRDLVAVYMAYARGHYRDENGQLTLQVDKLEQAFKPLTATAGEMPADEFGPRALKDIRDAMIALGWARRTINERVGCVKRMFKWASSEEHIPASVYHGLLCVDGLRAGRDGVPEPKDVKPVANEHVEAVLLHLPPSVQAMVRLQLLTGMRPQDVCNMRTCDVQTRHDGVWEYRPVQHKNRWRGQTRLVILGPNARQILKPLLLPKQPEAYIFSPARAQAERKAAKRRRRKSKIQPSQLDRSKADPLKTPGPQYTTASYRQAVAHAIDRANEGVGKKADRVPAWTPNQLRHAAATRIRRACGLDAARAALGQKTLAIADTYAELDRDLAVDVARTMG